MFDDAQQKRSGIQIENSFYNKVQFNKFTCAHTLKTCSIYYIVLQEKHQQLHTIILFIAAFLPAQDLQITLYFYVQSLVSTPDKNK